MIQPIGALIWGALIFNENLSPLQGAGVVIILAGVTAINLRGSVRPVATDLAESARAP
jgi:drug/metabolite transporter (DMT)-like permease